MATANASNIKARLEQAVAHHQAGRLDVAEGAYSEILDSDPEHPDALHFFGLLRFRQGRGEEAVDLIERAIEINPRFAGFRYNLGNVLCELGRTEDAVEHYRAAAELEPANSAIRNNLGNVLAECGRYDEAVAVLRDVVAARPDFAGATFNLASALLESGDAAAALAVCEDFERRGRRHCGLMASKAVALAELGRTDEARFLHSYDRLVRPARIEVPAGFGGLAAFNAALRDHILGHPTLRADPFGHATRNGRHTEELLAEPWGPMRDMEALISAAVRDYLASLPADPNHPYLSYRPDNHRLTAWAVVMGQHGHQVAHNHPSAWVSGVYYVEVPEVVERSGPDREGWLEFGRPADRIPISYVPETKTVKPEEGLMVLFPGFMYHHTIPYRDDTRRISLAFDAVAMK
jgi:Flp pilus assembly protein TadD